MRCTIRMLGITWAIGICVFAPRATFADPVTLLPGTTVSVPQNDTFAADVGSGYTVVDQFSASMSNGGLSATLYADAIRTAGGTIDLLYQVTNNSASATVDGLNVTDFSNVPGVAVAGLSDTSIAGTNFVTPTSPPNAPNSATRTPTPGATIDFTFASSSLGDILPGQTSAITLIVTGDTSWDSRGTGTVTSLSTNNGSVAFNGLPEPTVGGAVPEPGSLALGSLGLLSIASLCCYRRLRRMWSGEPLQIGR